MDLEMLRISTREDGERVLEKTLPGNNKLAFTFEVQQETELVPSTALATGSQN